jgi:phosphatidylserine/phosphatidylglycerophosphate/cardiolipin synthase-like enzyme
MRSTGSSGGLGVLAIAGSFVVTLGWNLSLGRIRSRNVLGFAIRRHRHSDGEIEWLTGLKTFESVEAHPPPGVGRSSRQHPFQTFQWADYSVSPGQTYTYRVVARKGQPTALVDDALVEVTVTTEQVDQGRHAVFFNRGAIASQEYARRFQNRPPDEVGAAAYEWLSRGLVEGLETFIAQAGAGDELHGAFYEFESPRIHAVLAAARDRGAAITVLYDADSARVDNETAIAASGIAGLCKPRTRSGGFAHNKFVVYSPAGQPAQVWTGSTNLSENGIFGHSNNAHIVRDAGVAASFRAYWDILDADLTRKPTATAVTALSPQPPAQPAAGASDTDVVFSPRLDLEVLDWYASRAKAAKRGLFMTFAFGMDARFVEAYDRPDRALRFALMEKKGNGATFAEQSKTIDRIRRLPNTTIAVGAKIELNSFDRWLAETDRATGDAHVLYVHTKYMLVDPLGPDPLIVIGSANFSKASTESNDENMLVIRGAPAVADVYLGEFMRLFSHYAFRESLAQKNRRSFDAAFQPNYLRESTQWAETGYFDTGSDRYLRRRYFSGG